MEQGNFDNYEVGDLVICDWASGYKIVPISRITKNFINVQTPNGNYRYRKSNGCKTNHDGWHFKFIYPATKNNMVKYEKAMNEARQKSKIRKLKAFDYGTLRDDDIDAIMKIING